MRKFFRGGDFGGPGTEGGWATQKMLGTTGLKGVEFDRAAVYPTAI